MVFRWRKRNEGFEWRTYVRTTILVRRHERRQRAEDVKAAAVFGVKKAGLKSADTAVAALRKAQAGSLAALRWTGRRAAAGAQKSAAGIAAAAGRGGVKAREGFGRGRDALGRGRDALGRGRDAIGRGRDALTPKLSAAGSAAAAAASQAARKLEPAVAPLREPGLQLALKLIAAVAALGALIRAVQFGWDGHVLVATAVAAAAGFLLLVSGSFEHRWPHGFGHRGLDALRAAAQKVPGSDRLSVRGLVWAALITVAVGGAWLWYGQRGAPSWPSLAIFYGAQTTPSSKGPTTQKQSTSPDQGPRDPSAFEGYATAQSGDTVRLSNRTVRLEGIEAPDRSQTCAKPGGKRWDCAATAREALSRLVRGRRVSCLLSSDTGGSNPATGRCTANGLDIAAELVAKGHVFAQSGLFAAYGSRESEAKTAKLGLWAGDAVRPADWRAVRWEEAKRQAPDGCPIKGQVFRKSGKVYMLPWSPDYERARVDKAQGERWFCSESEAVSAGWKPL